MKKNLTVKEWQVVCGVRLLRLQDAFIKNPTLANRNRLFDAIDEYGEAAQKAGKQ